MLAGTTDVPAGTFDAAGDLVVGRARWNSATTDQWFGDLDEVRVWQRVVGEREIAGAARPQPPSLRFPNGAQAAVGKPVTVNLSPAGDADVVAYRYSMDGSVPSITVRPAAPGGSVTVAVVPGDVDAVLKAVAVDRAGNESLVATSYELDVSARSGPPSMAHADLNNDGRSDVPIVYDNGNNETQLWNLTSTGDGFNTPTIAWTTGPGSAYPAAKLKTVAGDVDGDGNGDIAMFRDEGGGRSTLSVLRGDGNTYKLYPTVWDSGACGCSSVGSAKLVAGDFTGDGKADLAQLYDLGNATWELRVWASRGLVAGQPSFAPPTVWLRTDPGTSDWNQIRIVAGDVDGDGRADIAEFYNYPNGQTKLWMHSSQRDATTGAFSFTGATLRWDSGVGNWWWTASTFVCGDFTGDGKADVGIIYNYGSGVWRLWTLTGSSSGVDGPFEPAFRVILAG